MIRHLVVSVLLACSIGSAASALDIGIADRGFAPNKNSPVLAQAFGKYFSDWWPGRLDRWFHDFDRLGHFGGLFGGFGIWPHGGEWLQTSFEHRFERIQTKYDEGVSEIEDFYNSEAYERIVGHMEILVDRHDLFLTGVERSIDRLGNVILHANEGLEHIQDLLEEYQNRDDLPEKYLMRIEDLLTHAQDLLTVKIENLTEKQTGLTENLTEIQAFNGELTSYLEQIIADGMPPEEGILLVSELPLVAASGIVEEPSFVQSSGFVAQSGSVPEPASWTLAALAVVLGALGTHRTRRCG